MLQNTVDVLFENERPVAVYAERPEGLSPAAELRAVELVRPPSSPCQISDWDYGMDYVDSVSYVSYAVGETCRELCVIGDGTDARTAAILHELPERVRILRVVEFERDAIPSKHDPFEVSEEDGLNTAPTRLALELYERLSSENAFFLNRVVSDISWSRIERDGLRDFEAEDERRMETLRRTYLMFIRDCWDQFMDMYGVWGWFDNAYEQAQDVHERKVVLNLWAVTIDYGIPYLSTAVQMILDDGFPDWWREIVRLMEP